MSLRLRMLLAVLAVIALHAFIQIYLLVGEADRTLTEQRREQGEWVGRMLERALANALITNDLATVQSTAELVFSKRRFLRLAVLDEQGRSIIDLHGDDAGVSKVPGWFVKLLNLEAPPSTHRLTVGGVDYGTILTQVSPYPLMESVWHETREATGIHLAEIILLVFALQFTMSLGLRPLAALSATMRRIGGGDLSARVAETPIREFRGITSVVNAMATQIDALIARTKAQAASEKQARRLQEFHEITASAGLAEAKIRALLAMGCRHLGMAYGLVTRISGDTCAVTYIYPEQAAIGQGNQRPLAATYCEQTVRGNQVVCFHCVRDTNRADHPCYTETGIEAYIGAPIHALGDVFGTLNFVNKEPLAAPFHMGDMEFVKLMAQWIGLALDREQREFALWEAKEKAQVTLASIGDGVITTDTCGVVTYLNHVAESLTGWGVDAACGKPISKVFHVLHEKTRQPVANPVEQSLKEQRVIELAANAVLIRRDGSERAIEDSAAPILDHAGNTLGAVLVFRDVTAARDFAKQLEYFASHDQLTDLPNRRSFEASLRRVLENAHLGGRTHALCYIDLDQFKLVNDSCGHLAGDELLRQVSALLQTRLRGTDVLARLGGDEFGLILSNVTQEQAIATAGEMLQRVRNYRFEWQKRVFEIGASIGVVMIDDTAGSPEDALRKADAACYAVKHSGRNRVHLFQPSEIVGIPLLEKT